MEINRKPGTGTENTWNCGITGTSKKAQERRGMPFLHTTVTFITGAGTLGSTLIRCLSKKLRNECYAGCPPNTTCEWGICQCSNPNHIQIWGECVERGVTEACHQACHEVSAGVTRCRQACHQERNSTVFDEEAEGKPCTETLFCQEEDINLVCEGSSSVLV